MLKLHALLDIPVDPNMRIGDFIFMFRTPLESAVWDDPVVDERVTKIQEEQQQEYGDLPYWSGPDVDIVEVVEAMTETERADLRRRIRERVKHAEKI